MPRCRFNSSSVLVVLASKYLTPRLLNRLSRDKPREEGVRHSGGRFFARSAGHTERVSLALEVPGVTLHILAAAADAAIPNNQR